MTKRKDNSWQFKFSFTLAIVMLFLVFGYFTQSFLEIRKVKPIRTAIERISGTSNETNISSQAEPKIENADRALPE